MHLGRLVVSLCVTIAATAAQADVTPFELPRDLADAFRVRAGSVQNLTLPNAAGARFDVSVHLAGRTRVLTLAPHDVRAADFRLLIEEPTGIRQLPTPPSVTYRGSVVGVPGAEVAASLIAGQLSATVHFVDGTLWAVQPASSIDPRLPRPSHVVYAATDVIRSDGRCGVAAGLPAGTNRAGNGGGGVGPAAMKIAELAIDADRAYYTRYGSNATTVQNQITTIMNSVNVIFRRDVEIDHSITTLLVRTTTVYSWTGDLCNLLGQFASYWGANHAGIPRDMAHLFTGEGSFSGVVGCAFVGVVCGGSAYGASKAYTNNLVTDTGLVAHEMGHNWNAGHCDGATPCNIMCSGLGGCSGNLTAFAPVSINTIVAFKDSRGCLSNPPPTQPPVLTTLAPSTIPAWQPGQITVTGQRLDTVTGLTIGGASVPFGIVDANTIRFTPPSLNVIGTNPVIATNIVGPSNSLNLQMQGNHPSALVISPLLLRNLPSRVELHSDANWAGLLLFSTSNAASALPGFINLDIGNAFTDLYDTGFVTCATTGLGVTDLMLPLTAPVGLTLYWQAVTFSASNLSPPFEVSNVQQTRIL